MKIKIIQKVKPCLFIVFSLLLFVSCISSYVGYNGYEKWKYRRATFGNRKESIERGVFVKDLEYISNIKLDSFSVYIEKGFRYGYKGDYQTRILEDDKYPYQICCNVFIDKKNIYGIDSDRHKVKIDTMSSTYFLEKPELESPFTVKISKLVNKQWDSIGYIKVWDPSKQ